MKIILEESRMFYAMLDVAVKGFYEEVIFESHENKIEMKLMKCTFSVSRSQL